jgi:hypothetical protein
MKILFFTLLLVAIPSMAQAQKPLAPPFIYSPPSCNFEIKFPEKFFTNKKCVGNDCSEIVSFAKTIKDSTVDFRLTCDAKTADDITKIKATDLKASAKELADNAGLRSYGEDTATLPDGTISAVTIALGKRGDKDAIYTGQYWIGPNSLLTLEAEMRGPANKEIEKIYTQILESVKVRAAN